VTWSDLATLVVALGTVALAYVTNRQVRLSRTSLDLSIRPLLADPSPPTATSEAEDLLFGAPGRISAQVKRGALFYTDPSEPGRDAAPGEFHLSVAFENIGAGAAAIVDAAVEPSVRGEIYVSRRFVPVGEIVRVNVSVLADLSGMERFRDMWWAMEGLSVLIRYTDSNGGQPLTSRAIFRQAATRTPYVEEVAIFAGKDQKLIARGRGSY
jgi:hypothetical protein